MSHLADELKHLTKERPIACCLEQSAGGERVFFKPSVGFGRGRHHLKIRLKRGGTKRDIFWPKQPLNIGAQGRLVVFDFPQIVATRFDNLPRQFPLGEHSIARDNLAVDIHLS